MDKIYLRKSTIQLFWSQVCFDEWPLQQWVYYKMKVPTVSTVYVRSTKLYSASAQHVPCSRFIGVMFSFFSITIIVNFGVRLYRHLSLSKLSIKGENVQYCWELITFSLDKTMWWFFFYYKLMVSPHADNHNLREKESMHRYIQWNA